MALTTLKYLDEKKVKELRAAGRLLEADAAPFGKITITPNAGDTYEHAVMEAIRSLSNDAKKALRSLVDWVIDYEKHDKR